MIRKRLHRRWVAGNMGEALMRTIARTRPSWTDWIDRYFTWHNRRYGDTGVGPWPVERVTEFVCWCFDWRNTWRLRP